MKITSLSIKKLHDIYDYEVKFFPDVTFIFGSNGCGKTTVLNILEAIISGRIIQLFSYIFVSIVLSYCGDNNEKHHIEIKQSEGLLIVRFETKDTEIRREDIDRITEMSDTFEEYSLYLSKEYPLFNIIKETFNNVYLPLNRFVQYLPDTIYNRRNSLNIRRNRYSLAGSDEIMGRISSLIEGKYQEAISEVNQVSDEFRNEVLRSLVTLKNHDNSSITQLLIKQKSSEIENIEKQYISLLTNLDFLDEKETHRVNKFFEDFKYERKKMEDHPGAISIALVFNYQEIAKIKALLPLAEKYESRKKQAMKSFSVFLNTMNDFIGEEGDKKIIVTERGRIELCVDGINQHVPISNLSSGEKQLLTFFANLIFNVDNNTSGIFVMDEPELSLHLAWQKRFVEKALEINPNIQMIFATHSPEIIGNRRDRMYKLEKRIN